MRKRRYVRTDNILFIIYRRASAGWLVVVGWVGRVPLRVRDDF